MDRTWEVFERAKSWFRLPALILSLALLPITVLPMITEISASAQRGLAVAGWVIWAFFVFEYLMLLYLAPDRKRMVRTHVLELALVAVPILRPLRVARVLRPTLSLFRVMTTRKTTRTYLAVLVVAIVGGGGFVSLFERQSPDGQILTFADGIWWAFVTSTTVGYGDFAPVTQPGRVLAGVLMVLGVGLLSVLTANVAAHFVETDSDDELDDLRSQVAANNALIHDLITELRLVRADAKRE